jgi:hypothetical protein
MAALAADKVMQWGGGGPLHLQEFPVLTNVHIYKGAGVCAETAVGYARPIAASLTGPEFYGFAMLAADNNPGASGAINVLCSTEGIALVTAITGLTGITDVNTAVYMSDDQTFTNSATNNVAVGKVVNFDGTYFHVFYQATARASI